MISRLAWYARATLKKVWVRVACFAGLALVAASLARGLSPFLPERLVLQTGSDAVTDLLGILTSSMLAVTTFSLSIAVSAFAAAAGSATPRAAVLLQQDTTTQNVLATFLGAFLFGLVGLIALYADFYDASGKVVVFFFTIGVIGLVVIALIRWIGHLMDFGRMGDTLDRVECAAAAALAQRLEHPFLGGRPLTGPVPQASAPVRAAQTGYIQHIDMQALQDCAKAMETSVYLAVLPGSFVAPGTPLLAIENATTDADRIAAVRGAFAIGPVRHFEDDPRFGVIVLTEIASRALSPAVNDPGTAIDIIGRHVRLLAHWRDRDDAALRFDRVHVPPILLLDVIEDAFRPIARDGAGLFEVQIRLQKALGHLARLSPRLFGPACRRMAQEALERAGQAALLPSELAALQAAAAQQDAATPAA